jgi:outer membrane protein assembly factor BamD (BamD/ComL family)
MSLVAAFAIAPVQCAHKPDPDVRREDSPGDALWGLAESFRAKGDETSARETLRYLLEKYPASRHAEEARRALGGTSASASDGGSASSANGAKTGEGR